MTIQVRHAASAVPAQDSLTATGPKPVIAVEAPGPVAIRRDAVATAGHKAGKASAVIMPLHRASAVGTFGGMIVGMLMGATPVGRMTGAIIGTVVGNVVVDNLHHDGARPFTIATMGIGLGSGVVVGTMANRSVAGMLEGGKIGIAVGLSLIMATAVAERVYENFKH